jgi:hypothetical protein
VEVTAMSDFQIFAAAFVVLVTLVAILASFLNSHQGS